MFSVINIIAIAAIWFLVKYVISGKHRKNLLLIVFGEAAWIFFLINDYITANMQFLQIEQSPHHKMRRYIEVAWILSTGTT